MYYIIQGLLRGLEQQGCENRILPLRLYSKPIQSVVLAHEIETFRPDIVLTPGWSIGLFDEEQYNETIERSGLFHVYWATEDPVFWEKCTMVFAPRSDYVFTTAEECLPRYAELGKPASVLLFGCNPEVHRRVAPKPRYAHDIILVANNYHQYHEEMDARRTAIRNVLMPLIDERMDVGVYGVEWTSPTADIRVPEAFYGGYCPYKETASAYSSAKIVLGIQSVDTSPTQTSCRTFEILGSGAFYLTSYTPSHERLFENHKHLVWSKSPEETVELVKYYLVHDEERERIARSGQAYVYEHHSYVHRAREFLDTLTPRLKG
jgi:spore maturation protein CgeB